MRVSEEEALIYKFIKEKQSIEMNHKLILKDIKDILMSDMEDKIEKVLQKVNNNFEYTSTSNKYTNINHE